MTPKDPFVSHVCVTLDPYVKLKSNPGPNGPNFHIGSPVLPPGGAVTWAVKVAVNGADPEVADALIVTEQCSTGEPGEFDVGCEAANMATIATITTNATTALTWRVLLPRRSSCPTGGMGDSGSGAASPGDAGTRWGGTKVETSVRTPQ